METVDKKVRLIIYDTKKAKFVEAETIHEYIQIFKNSYGQNKDEMALKTLASNFMMNNQLTDAAHMYEALLDIGDPDFVYAMLAQIEYQKLQYENAKKFLAKINIATVSAEVAGIVTKQYLDLQEGELALKFAQKYEQLVALNKQDYFMLAQVYELNYVQNLNNPLFLNRTVLYYDKFFYKRFNDRAEIYFYEEKDNYFPHAIIYMLFNKDARIAIELIDVFFDWLTIPSRHQLEQTISEKVKINETPAMAMLDEIKDYTRYNELFHELKNSINNVYSHLVPLLFELKAIAYAQLEEWDEAKESLKLAKSYITTSDSFERLAEIVKNEQKIAVELLESYRLNIHQTFVPLKNWHEQDGILYIEEQLKKLLKDIQLYINLQSEEKLDSAFELVSFYLGNVWRPKLKGKDETRQIIISKLRETMENMKQHSEKKDFYDPLVQFINIDQIENHLWKERSEYIEKKTDQLIITDKKDWLEKDKLQLQKISNIMDLWISTEQYYDYLKNAMSADTKIASILVVGYFKIVEVWLVKLFGEISTGAQMIVGNRNNRDIFYKVGENIKYYTATTLGNYYNFVKDYDVKNLKYLSVHPVKESRINQIQNFYEKIEKFGNERNLIAHKGEISLEDAEKLRDEFYEVIVYAMDTLKEVIESK